MASTGAPTVTTLGVTNMTTYKLYSIDELVTAIYEDNLNHFEFHENMGGEDCDCHIHTTIKTIVEYWGE